jgi:glycosyltransferase involved in cell wall biosynthesis
VGNLERFAVVPLGIDIEQFDSDPSVRQKLRAEFGVQESDVVVGFVGRLTEIKNISLLLHAAARIRERKDVKFAIVGDGHLRPDLEQKAASLDIGSNTIFLGNRSDISDIYSALDIVALTSLNEGTPLSLIEAMAAGKPVISTGVGGVRDLLGAVREEYGGFSICDRGIRVESFEPADYQAGLTYLVENRQWRAEIAERGRKYIRSRYGKDRLIDDIKRLYRELNSE